MKIPMRKSFEKIVQYFSNRNKSKTKCNMIIFVTFVYLPFVLLLAKLLCQHTNKVHANLLKYLKLRINLCWILIKISSDQKVLIKNMSGSLSMIFIFFFLTTWYFSNQSQRETKCNLISCFVSIHLSYLCFAYYIFLMIDIHTNAMGIAKLCNLFDAIILNSLRNKKIKRTEDFQPNFSLKL